MVLETEDQMWMYGVVVSVVQEACWQPESYKLEAWQLNDVILDSLAWLASLLLCRSYVDARPPPLVLPLFWA